MLNPIKRVWVPKKPIAQSEPQAQTTAPVGAAPVGPAEETTTSKRGMLFDELPKPDVTEKCTDSVWAEFDSVLQSQVPPK